MKRTQVSKRKYLPLVIGLLLLAVLIGIMIPMTGSAQPAGEQIKDFFCRNPQESLSDNKAALRFAFTTNVRRNEQYYGVVYSSTCDRPVIGKAGCSTAQAWKVHSSANTTLDGHSAGTGRYWVEIKIGNIWHTHYDDVYYVRPYVIGTDGTYYYGDDVVCTSVNETFGHKHTVPSPVSTTSATSLLEPGTKVGTCSVCGRGNRVEYVNPTITSEHFTSSSSGTYVKKANIYSSMLHGARHFYPDSTNDNKGNDLLIEFSFLWNPSLANLKNAYMAIGRLANSNGGDDANAFYLNFADNVSGMWVPYAGSFEGGEYNSVVYGPEGVYKQSPARSECAFIGEYGWHRIGVRIHEDAWIESNQVRYKVTATLYVDGHALSQLSKTYASANNNLLFTASVVNGHLQYTDIPDGRTVYGIRLENRKTNSGTTADFIFAEYSVTCGRSFQQDVMPVTDAINRLPSSYNTTVFYRAINHERMPTGFFDLPASISDTNPKMIQPTEGQHPRLLVTTDNYQAVKTAALASDNSGIFNDVVELATDPNEVSFTLTSLRTSTYTVMGPQGHPVQEEHQMQDCDEINHVCAVIRAKAFVYLINDMNSVINARPSGSNIDVNTIGSQAISMMMDLLNQIDDISDQDPDSVGAKNKCRTFGEAMFTAALVYDWCYDLLDSAEKETMIRLVADKLCKQFEENPNPSYDAAKHRMEVSFPPYKQSPVNDHGCERQILRDYLSFSLAIFDEDRSWYDFVGGRFFEQFVPVRNEIYKSGYSTQGFSNYLQIRFSSDLWSAWLMKSATGVFPYESENNMKQVMRSAFTHLVKVNKAQFYEGDYDGKKSPDGIGKSLAFSAMISAYLFEDTTAMKWAANREYSDIPNEMYLILKSNNVTEGSLYDGLDTILYNGGYLKQTITHNNFAGCDAAVFMKICGVRIGGHDHDDAGSFQIILNKTPMAVDSGVYDTWNSNQHRYYHRRTIAHNSVVFYNDNGSNLTQQTTNVNGGGTGSVGEFLDACANPNVSHFAHAEEYNGTNPKYAYLAGDIAGTYETGAVCTVNRMDRRMLAVYATGDNLAPLYFFVFDATQTATNAKPAFLLHVPAGSTSSVSGKSITVLTNDGRLILQNVYCGNGTNNAEIYEYLDDDKYVVGQNNYVTSSTLDPSRGRYEIVPTSSLTTGYMLNAMIVAPKDKNITASNRPATYFASGSAAIGTKLGKVAVLFVKASNPTTQTLTFTAAPASSETLYYYVSGLAAGTWRVTDSNGSVNKTVSADSNLLQFDARTGSITLTYLGGN